MVSSETAVKILFWLATSTGVASFALLLAWYLQFRGGFTWWYDVDHLKLLFSWHPILITTGLVLLNGLAMLMYRVMPHGKGTAKWLHGVLQAVGFVLTVLGCHAVVVRRNLNDPPKPHLYNIHGWFGILAVFLFACQLFVGVAVFVIPRIPDTWKATYLKMHVVFGPAILILSSCSAILGVYDIGKKIRGYDQFCAEGLMANFTASCIMVFTGITVYLVLYPSYNPKVYLAAKPAPTL